MSLYQAFLSNIYHLIIIIRFQIVNDCNFCCIPLIILFNWIVIIIIIMSSYQGGYPWPSLATPSYHPLLPVGLQEYTPYRHRAAVCMFELVALPLLGHVKGVHKTTSLISSSLLPQHCPACLVGLIWIVFVMGGRWPYSCCFVGCCLQDLFSIARSILV